MEIEKMLEEISDFRKHCPHIMLFEVVECFGPCEVTKVVLYNKNHVTRETAMRIIKAGDFHPAVLVIPKPQWEYLFLNRKED